MPSCKIICIEPVRWRCQVINAVHTGGVNRIKAIQGNIIEAPLHHNSFDVVLALEVIEHIPEATLAIAEMMRISRKHIIISVPSKPDKNPDHVHFFPPELLKSTLIEAAGIANKKLRRIKFNYVRNSMITLIRLEYGE
jgi:ubiquinone/menaquinone biosynthesis C-methylase UbiE